MPVHHIGFVVASIAESGAAFAKSLGATWDGQVIHDPLQDARVSFLSVTTPGGGPTIELVEPASAGSPLHRFLGKGGGLHHVCLEVESLEHELAERRAAGCLIVKQPLPAVAFNGRRIAWVYTPQKLLVEYLEAAE